MSSVLSIVGGRSWRPSKLARDGKLGYMSVRSSQSKLYGQRDDRNTPSLSSSVFLWLSSLMCPSIPVENSLSPRLTNNLAPLSSALTSSSSSPLTSIVRTNYFPANNTLENTHLCVRFWRASEPPADRRVPLRMERSAQRFPYTVRNHLWLLFPDLGDSRLLSCHPKPTLLDTMPDGRKPCYC